MPPIPRSTGVAVIVLRYRPHQHVCLQVRVTAGRRSARRPARPDEAQDTDGTPPHGTAPRGVTISDGHLNEILITEHLAHELDEGGDVRVVVDHRCGELDLQRLLQSATHLERRYRVNAQRTKVHIGSLVDVDVENVLDHAAHRGGDRRRVEPAARVPAPSRRHMVLAGQLGGILCDIGYCRRQ